MTFVSYAQNFEDIMLWRALRDVENGCYIDIGAQDPVVDSVSLSFYEAGWRGIHVEPTSFYAARLRELRPDETVIEAAVTDAAGPIEFFEIPGTGLSTGIPEVAECHAKSDFETRKTNVPCVRLDRLLEMSKPDLQWLKIDVEGMESDVLRSWGKSERRPWLLVIESTFPNTQKPTEHKWLEDVIDRGYAEAYFDGLSRFFVHETQKHRAEFLKTPANLFDGFEISRFHFACRRLRAELEDAEAHFFEANTQAQNRLSNEQAIVDDLRQRLEGAEQKAGDNASLTSDLRIQLEGWEKRFAELQALASGLQTQLSDSERARNEAQSDLKKALQQLERAESRHRQAVDAIWREQRDAEEKLRCRSETAQAELRERLESARSFHAAKTAELREAMEEARIAQSAKEASLREALESARLANAVGEAERARLEERVARLQVEAARAGEASARQQADADTTHAELSATLDQTRNDLLQVQRLIENALADPPRFWRSFGQSFGMGKPPPSWAALREWSPSAQSRPSTTRSINTELPMELAVPQECRSPYLRASSLPELLSWDDSDFVRCAYVTVLGRQPDPAGEFYYTERIRSGASKLQILWQLRNSSESRSHDPGIAGLDRTLRQYRQAGWPVIGALFGRRYVKEWSPAEHQARRFENTFWRAQKLQTYRLSEIQKHIERIGAQSMPADPTQFTSNATRQENSDLAKATLEFSEPLRNDVRKKAAEDIFSRFSHAAVINIRSKFNES